MAKGILLVKGTTAEGRTMKNVLLILALGFTSLATRAQGTIFFNNRTSVGDVRVFGDASYTVGAGSLGTVNAQLFLQPAGGGALVPLTPATTFRNNSAAASFFVNPVDVTVPGYAAGTSATIVMRAWLGSDFATATIRGQSDAFTIASLGGINPATGAIVPTPDLAGMQGFTLVLPEPSTIALGVLGAAALLYRRK
jgi:hypothetical protein